MKSILGVLALSSILAVAQTNSPDVKGAKQATKPPTQEEIMAGLATVTNKLAQVITAQSKLREQQKLTQKKIELAVTSGQLRRADAAKKLKESNQQFDSQVEALRKQRAALELQEIEIRQRYNLPKDKNRR